MATGPENYMLSQNALLTALIDGIPAQDVTKLQLDAIGHAILALAAAVGTYGSEERSREDVAEWERVAGEFTRQSRIRAEYEKRERAEAEAEAAQEAWAEQREAAVDEAQAAKDAEAYVEPVGDEDDGDEHHFSRAQMDGEACTECGGTFAIGEATVPSVTDFIEGQLFAHAICPGSEASK